MEEDQELLGALYRVVAHLRQKEKEYIDANFNFVPHNMPNVRHPTFIWPPPSVSESLSAEIQRHLSDISTKERGQ